MLKKALILFSLSFAGSLLAQCPSMPKLIKDQKVTFSNVKDPNWILKLTGVDILMDGDDQFNVLFKCSHSDNNNKKSPAIRLKGRKIIWNKNRWKGICLAQGKLSRPTVWTLDKRVPYVYSRLRNGGTTGSIKVGDQIWSYIREDNKKKEHISLMIHRFDGNDEVSYVDGILTPGLQSWDKRSVAGADVIKVGKEYWMYYRGSNFKNQMKSHIGLAKSKDGRHWTKYKKNPVFSRSASGWDSRLLADPHVLKHNDQYWMFYSGHNNVNLTQMNDKDFIGLGKQIGLAVSKDGINWQRCFNKPFIDKHQKSDNAYALIKGNRLMIWFRTLDKNHGFGGELWYHEYELK